MKLIYFMPKLEPEKQYHYMPVSLLAAAIPAVAAGHDVRIIDERVGDSLEGLDDADAFMVSVYAGFQVTRAYAVSKWVKKHYPSVKVAWGGPFVTALDKTVLDGRIIDYIVPGDVDDDSQPLPYHLIDVEKYVNPATKRFIYVSSYGCPGKCTFCQTVPRRPFKLLPMERVQADINNLMARYPFKECVFFDATLFAANRVRQISDLMRRHNLQWIADARAQEISKCEESFLASCVNSGLKQLTIGLESGSPRVIEMMQKGTHHLEYFKLAAEKLKDLPIKMVSGVIFGCPGETVDDLRQTIDYIRPIKEINPNFYISTTFFRPLPGTAMTEMAKEYGYKAPETLKEWSKAGESTHYNYNTWNDVPWIAGSDKYQVIYEDFKQKNSDLFV
jgi:hypothetical protein